MYEVMGVETPIPEGSESPLATYELAPVSLSEKCYEFDVGTFEHGECAPGGEVARWPPERERALAIIIRLRSQRFYVRYSPSRGVLFVGPSDRVTPVMEEYIAPYAREMARLLEEERLQLHEASKAVEVAVDGEDESTAILVPYLRCPYCYGDCDKVVPDDGAVPVMKCRWCHAVAWEKWDGCWMRCDL